jgi:predicted patatin/cPLA2 family phospholipase
MEYAWRNLLSDKKFVRTGKKLKRGQVLNLGYLYQLMTKGNLKLNVDKIFKSKTNIKYVLTEYKTGKVVYISPQKDNIFKLITGSSALLPFYRPVKINNKEYIDGALGGEPTPFNMKFIEKYDKILIIQNVNYKEKIIVATLKMLTFLTPKKIDKIIDHYLKNIKDIERARKHENVFLLTPSKTMPLKSRFDTNKKRINATFDLGIEDAKRAIEFLRK